MITVTKQENGVLFTFQDSDKYLYGSGTILVPFNTLSIVADKSDMITLKKAASNDVFISARYDTDLGYRSKDDAIDDLKGMLFAETGGGSESGITSGEVQTMIDNSLEDYYTDDEVDAALSGKASVSDVTAVANDVSTLSGQVATKVAINDFNAYSAATDARLAEDEEVTSAALNDLQENKADASAVTAVNDALTAHTSDTGIHVTQADKTSWNAKQDRLYLYTEDNNLGTAELHSNDSSIIFSAGGASITANNPLGINTFNVAATGVTINDEAVATESYVDAAISGKADTSAVTAAIDAAISGKADTSAITSSITSASTNDEVAGAKAVYDAIQAGGGGGATYSAGTNISIDTANTINCTLPISVTSNNQYSIKIGNSGGNSYGNNNLLIGSSISANFSNSVGIGSTITLGANNTLGLGQNITTLNEGQLSCGFYNVSNKANSTKGDSGNTLVSVGNGYYHYPIQGYHNAFEIRQNGDLYFADTDNTTYQNYYEKPMVRLQDMYAALGGLKFVKLTQSQYDNLATKDPDTLYIISNVVS